MFLYLLTTRILLIIITITCWLIHLCKIYRLFIRYDSAGHPNVTWPLRQIQWCHSKQTTYVQNNVKLDSCPPELTFWMPFVGYSGTSSSDEVSCRNINSPVCPGPIQQHIIDPGMFMDCQSGLSTFTSDPRDTMLFCLACLRKQTRLCPLTLVWVCWHVGFEK